MIILGIDPGTVLTGFGIIESRNNILTPLHYGVINLPSKQPIPARLQIIYDTILGLTKVYRPDAIAIETAFYGKNVQSALKLGYARGVAILATMHAGAELFEYSPREVKKAVVGNGAASKEQVQFMVGTLLKITSGFKRFDESDALGIAICHALRAFPAVSSKKNWKSFVEAHPERVLK